MSTYKKVSCCGRLVPRSAADKVISRLLHLISAHEELHDNDCKAWRLGQHKGKCTCGERDRVRGKAIATLDRILEGLRA